MTPFQAYRAALEAAAKVNDQEADRALTAIEKFKSAGAHYKAREAAHCERVLRGRATAIRALPVPEDNADVMLVPKEPTEGMLEAGRKAWKKPRMHVNFQPADELNTCGVIYRAMIEAKE